MGVLKRTFTKWSEDKAARLAAALAYYTVFSLAPLLLILIAVAGFVFGERAAQGQIESQIQGIVGPDTAKAIQTMIHNASNPRSGIIATALSLVTLLFGASGVFNELQDGLNTVWEVMPRPDRGFRGMLRDRLWSFVMVLGVAAILLLSMIASTVLSALKGYFAGLFPGLWFLPELLDNLLSFGIGTLLFAMIYKVLPDVRVGWRDVWVGAAVTSLLFTAGKFLIGLYLAKSSAASAYGAAGSLVLILLWVYYSAQILFLGAEFTQAYANRYGSHIVPGRHAMRVQRQVVPQPAG